MIKVSRLLTSYFGFREGIDPKTGLENVFIPITYGAGSRFAPWDQYDAECEAKITLDHAEKVWECHGLTDNDVDPPDVTDQIQEWVDENYPGYQPMPSH